MSRSLDNWINGYLAFTEDQESPEAFHFWMALVVISAALRRRVWLDRGWDGYLVYPNIYVLLVADSASMRKSQAIDMGLPILQEAVPDIYTIADTVTPEGIVKHLNRVTHAKGSNGVVKVSTESSLLIHADELASLFSFDKQRASRMGILLTRVYRSPKVYQHTTAGEGKVEIFNPYFTMIAATAPQNMKVIPQESTGGLYGRLIIVSEEERRATIAWGPRLRPRRGGRDLSALRQKLVADLFRISQLEGPIRLTEGAIDVFEKWYVKQASEKYSDPRIDAFHARCHDTALQIAILMCVATADDLVLEPEHVIAGIGAIEKQLPAFTKLVQWSGVSDFAQHRATAMDLMRRSGGYITRKALLRAMEMSVPDFDSLMISMCESGVASMKKTGAQGVVYKLNDETFGA